MPVSEFKAQAADVLKRLAEDDRPVVITQNGKAAGVLLSPAEYDRLTERERVIAAIEAGLRDDDEGRVYTHEEAVKRLRSRFKGRQSR